MQYQQLAGQRGEAGGAPPRRRWVRRLAIAVTVIAALAAADAAAGAAVATAGTALSCPGGSFNLCIPPQGANGGVKASAGATVVAGYDFTLPGPDTTTVIVRNAFEQLTVSCADGSAPTQPTISIPMPDATYTAPFQSSQGWVPTGDQSSMASYEGSLTLPDLCHGGTIDVGQPGQMMFAAQVQSNGTSPLSFRSHYNDASLSVSGSWSATATVTPAPITQTIQGEIFLCVNGKPTTTLASGGTISVPAASLSSPNPLPPTNVAAGSYTMNAAAPSGEEFVACGQAGVTITSPSSAHQTVTVPAGGAGDGKFYVQAVPKPTGFLEICKQESGTGLENDVFTFSVAGQDFMVPVGACTPAIKVTAGNVTVKELAMAGSALVNVSTIPVTRLISVDLSTRTAVVKVVAGGVSSETIVTFTNKSVPGTGILKVCQVAGPGIAVGTDFSFTVGTKPVTVPAGPAPGGLCVIAGKFPFGDQTITQTIPSGDQVTSIVTAPSSRQDSVNLAAGTATVDIGSGVTEVTYTDASG